jgi:hypothetical protein
VNNTTAHAHHHHFVGATDRKFFFIICMGFDRVVCCDEQIQKRGVSKNLRRVI